MVFIEKKKQIIDFDSEYFRIKDKNWITMTVAVIKKI